MGPYQLLFDLEVVHRYFADPVSCRLVFRPDAATARWLSATGCVARASGNALKVYYETAGSSAAVPPAPAKAWPPVSLTFWVTAADPLFSACTDGLATTNALAPGSAPLLVFDAAEARQEAATGAWIIPPAPTAAPVPSRGGLNVRPDFAVVIGRPADTTGVGRTYRVVLQPRAMVWKYWLTGDWSADRPCLVEDRTARNPPLPPVAFEDPFPAAPGQPPQTQLLADGRSAIAIKSTAPVLVEERSARRIQLWSRNRAGARRQMLIDYLPVAGPGSLALENPDDPTSLVSEIFVPFLSPSPAP